MLCSLPAPKSSSTWLDRLHSLKGFNIPNSPISNANSPNPNHNPNPPISNPNSSNSNPNHSISNPNSSISNNNASISNPNSSITNPNSSNSNPSSSYPNEQMGHFNLVSNILSDLFVMDAPNSAQSQTLTLKIGAKRGLRKQANPRICVYSANKTKIRNYTLPSGDSEVKSKKSKRIDKLKVHKNIKKDKKIQIEKKKMKKRKVETDLNLDLDSNLNPKFGTEATVIDTSTPGWKSCKILFRKGSNWKVRDKKQFTAAKKKKKKNFGLVKSNEEPSSSTSLQKSHIPAINEDTRLEEPIDPIQIPIIRPKCKPSVGEAAKSIALHLKVRTKEKKKSSPLSKSSSLKGKIKT